MRFWPYILLCMSLSISLWFLGFATPLTYVLGIDPQTIGQAHNTSGTGVYQGKPFDASTFLQRMGQLFSNQESIAGLLGLLVISAAISLAGFSSIYFIPVVMLIFILPFVILPIGNTILGTNCTSTTDPQSCFGQNGFPDLIYYPLMLILDVIGVMACISFVRGQT